MDNMEFLTNGTNVVLPTRKNPKVYLNIESGQIAREAFKLYNPFSNEAKVLKLFTKFLCVHLNSVAKVVLPTVRGGKSNFIHELEEKFETEIKSSLYLSTAKDKVVIQLQANGGILGYLKYAISPLGHQRIENEKKAIQMLSELGLVHKLIDEGSYENKPFIILQNMEGSIGNVEPSQYLTVLDLFKKQRVFKLKNHPRIQNLISKLEQLQLDDLSQKLQHEIEHSKESYNEVFEHGDFAPWNLIKIENKLVAFDLEYFEEKGLQHFDEIKYHFQLNHLMHKKIGNALIKAISNTVFISEFNIIFLAFLLKEIVNKIEANENYSFESSLLNLLPLQAN